ncbi:MAG TPA: energy transducer TonB [Pyrinomonadaceae bacterium]|nr:energy transducer TonB [Pyrinomonadaceae bacterium]
MNVLTKIILFVLIGGAAVAQEQKPLSWSRYTVKDEEFSVLLPTLPAMTTTQALRKGDHERQRRRQLETSLDGVLYTIDVYQNPQPRQSLDEFIAEMSADLKYDPASERAFTVDGFSGKEYSATNNPNPFIVRFIATEKRLYRFMVRGPGVERPAAKEFLSSIKLGKNTEAVEVSEGLGIPVESALVDPVYAGKEVDVKARILDSPPPDLSTDASNRAAGIVILRVVFAKTGRVENITVIRGLPNGLTEKCIEAAKKIRFKPAMKDGQPVSIWMQLEYALPSF